MFKQASLFLFYTVFSNSVSWETKGQITIIWVWIATFTRSRKCSNLSYLHALTNLIFTAILCHGSTIIFISYIIKEAQRHKGLKWSAQGHQRNPSYSKAML